MRKQYNLLIIILAFAFLIIIDRWQVVTWHAEMDRELAETTNLYHSRFENAVVLRMNAVESLVALFVMHPETTLEEFNKYSAHIIRTNPTIRTLQFADSKTLIAYTYPSKGNEILIKKPLTLITDPKRGPYVKKAINQGSAAVQGPFNLREGGVGVVVRSPIFIERGFLGLAIGVYDIQVLIDNAFAGIDFDRYSFQLMDHSDTVFHGKEHKFDSVQKRTVKVGDTNWTMTVGRVAGVVSMPVKARFLVWCFGVGILFSILALFRKSATQNIKLEQKVEERTKKLNATNKALSIEIADRETTAEKLKNSEERYDLAMNAAQDGLYDWDLETNEIYYSIGWKKMLGYTDDELPNNFSVWEDLTDPNDVKRAWNMQSELIAAKRQRFEMEFRMRHKDGHWVDILSRASAVFNDAGDAIRIVGTHVDISERKKYENELKIRDAAIENSLNGFDIVDESGKLVYVNKAFVAMYGYDRAEELIGQSPAQLCEDPTLPENVIRTIREEGEYIFEHKAIRKDGSTFDVLMYARLAHDKEGNEIYPTTCIDVSERKKAEAIFKKSRLILESTSDAVVSTDVDGNIELWNSGAESIYGYQRDDVVGRSIGILYKEKDLPILEGLIRDLVDGNESSNVDVTCIHKDGRDINILLSLMAIRGEDGSVKELVGITKDISERIKYEKEITLQKETAERYLNLAGVVFVALNPKGEVTLINKKGCEVLGSTPDRIIGRNWFEHFLPSARKEEMTSISKSIMSGDIAPYKYIEHPILAKNGEQRLIAWHNTILRDEADNIIGHLSAGEDITEKARLEDQLQQAQKMESIGTLAGGIAHDFNNILSSILGFTEIALDDAPVGSPLEDSLQEVYTAGIRAKDLVKQILAFARQSDEKRSPVQPGAIVGEALKFLRSTLPATISIESTIESDSAILGNATQVHQVVLNLFTNAAQAMEDTGGMLTVGVRDVNLDINDLQIGMRSGDYVAIQVSDSGPGIAPEFIDSIFDPYFTTKGPGDGTGMGLAMAHGIVESYGGKILVDSQLGQGTTFTIQLPVTNTPDTARAKEPEPLPSGKERILVVDDEAAIAKMGQQMLERLGYFVTTRTSSLEALALFQSRSEDFDLVITDMTMPNMTGDKLAIEIMKIRRDIPVILCTGYSNKITDDTASDIGIKAFAYKPVVKADLARTVREVLDCRQAGAKSKEKDHSR